MRNIASRSRAFLWLLILCLTFSLLPGCSGGGGGGTAGGSSSGGSSSGGGNNGVWVHIHFQTANWISGYKNTGDGYISVPRGGSLTGTIKVNSGGQKNTWNVNVVYYNSTTDHKIVITPPSASQTVEINDNVFTATGFGAADITGYVEEKAPPPPPGSVTGRVTDYLTGQGISGAYVSVEDQSTETDSSGYYTLTDVPQGSQTIHILHLSNYQDNPTTVTVTGGGTVTANIVLTSSLGTLTGRVTDYFTGQGIQGASVGGGGRGTNTDSSGYYTLTNVPMGSQTIHIYLGNYQDNPTTVTVTGGGTVTANIVLTPSVGTVTGRVTDYFTGQGIQGASVGGGGRGANTDSSGYYTLTNVPMGSQTIHIYLGNYQDNPTTVTVTGGGTVTANIALTPSVGTVTGRVTDYFTGQGIQGASVGGGGRGTNTDSNGYYTLTNVPMGSQTIHIYLGNYQDNPTTVTVTAGGTVTANIVLTPSVGAVTGRVTAYSRANKAWGHL